MPYKTFLLITGILLFINFLIIKLVKGKAKVFVKKTNWYLLGAGGLCALLGLTGLLAKAPASMSVQWLYVLLQVGFLGLGVLHAWLLFEIHPWASRSLLKLELLFTTLVMLTGGLYFFAVFAFFEKGSPLKGEGLADNLTMGLLLFPLPLLLLHLLDRWEAIPRLVIQGWTPPFGTPPPSILPGNLVRLKMQVPHSFQSQDFIEFDTLAPPELTLGEMFYFLLYKHNIEKRSPKKIEIAEGNARDKTYQWLFFVPVKKWWWMSRKYFSPSLRVKQLGLSTGTVIYAARVRPKL